MRTSWTSTERMKSASQQGTRYFSDGERASESRSRRQHDDERITAPQNHVLEKPPQHLVCLLILSAAALYNEVLHFLCVCIETSSPNLASTARNIFFEATPTPSHQQNTYVIAIPFFFLKNHNVLVTTAIITTAATRGLSGSSSICYC